MQEEELPQVITEAMVGVVDVVQEVVVVLPQHLHPTPEEEEVMEEMVSALLWSSTEILNT